MTRTRRKTAGRWSRRPDCRKRSRRPLKPSRAGLLTLASSGELKNRQDVTEALERSGFEVVRTTKSSISIADPDGGETSD
ncbi:hypothetical protein AAG927_025320 (plasmid) [Enterobacter hormaechei]